MSAFEIRPARGGDGDGVAGAWRDSAEYYREMAPKEFQVPSEDGLSEWLENKLVDHDESTLALVADHAGQAVGFVHATFLPPHAEAERQMTRDVGLPRVFVNALAVRRAHWRGGAGTGLMRAVERWGRERGARLLTLEAFAGSPVSVPFYENGMGYDRYAIVFAKPL
ncbi:GNAT family N-acetyltransferase [Streptosporangium jomthongense]|uniref:GNAT family N-acetyltransferase n=1 Tax=Streptosporangium jomthongense TaxID=1193683 RepID=A0ABV8EUS1_9ACTN